MKGFGRPVNKGALFIAFILKDRHSSLGDRCTQAQGATNMQDDDGVPWQHLLSFISIGPRAWMWYIFYIIISMNQLSFGPSIPNRGLSGLGFFQY